MLFIVTPCTIRNVKRLNLRRVGAQMLGRGFRVVPRGGPTSGVFWRILFDQAPFRYCLALSPFPIAMLVRPDLALAISQAPLLMFALVVLIESSVLSVSTPAKRNRLIEAAEAARGLDILQQRGKAALARLAAGRGLKTERLHLIVEQSGLARVPVLTLASIQQEGDAPGSKPLLLDLDAAEQTLLEEGLFDEGFPEERLHLINLRENKYLRDIAFEAAAVTAHARLLAMAATAERPARDGGAPPEHDPPSAASTKP
ncbi:MAG: hypothetical protein AAGG09_01135 [Pseudomonadota bacterium]